jgi:hypothetical protein
MKSSMLALMLLCCVPGPQAFAGDRTDACSFLTVADAESVIGKISPPPKARTGDKNSGYESSCIYSDVLVTTHPSQQLDAELKKPSYSKEDFKPAPDLGPHAWQINTGAACILVVQSPKQDFYIKLLMRGVYPEKCTQLGKKLKF